MSIFDDLKGKADGLIAGREDSIKGGIGKAGDVVDDKTGDKYRDQIDKAQKAATDYVDGAAQ